MSPFDMLLLSGAAVALMACIALAIKALAAEDSNDTHGR